MTETNNGWWRTTVEAPDHDNPILGNRVLWSVDWGVTKGHQWRRPTKNMIIDMLEDLDMSTWPEDWSIHVYRVELLPSVSHVRTYAQPMRFQTRPLYIGCEVAYVADYDKVHEDCPRGKIVADEVVTMSDYQSPRESRGPTMTMAAWLVLWDPRFRQETDGDTAWIWKHDKDLIAL